MSGVGGKREGAALDDSLMDFSLDELREFLEADLVDVRADPEFKERLRRRLWDLVRDRSGPGGAGGAR
jgi:hypothetical protein